MTDELKRRFRFGTKDHEMLVQAVQARRRLAEQEYGTRWSKWKKDEEAFMAYMPEREADRLLRRDREQKGKPHFTTLVLPASYGLALTIHTYLTSVFLSRAPIFQYQGRHGEAEDAILAVEALIDYQRTAGRWLPQLFIWLMDMPKYGLGVLGNYWDEEVSQVSEFVSEPVRFFGLPTDQTKVVRRTRQVKGFHGNRLYNIRPYNFKPDPRVSIAEFQKGEFVIVETDQVSVMDLRENADYFNKDVAQRTAYEGRFEEGTEQRDMPVPEEEVTVPVDLTSTKYGRTDEMYIRLVPKDWNLGQSERSEKWVITLWNNRVIVGLWPLGENHNQFPFALLEYEVDGYPLAKRSFFEIARPMQNVIDWLVNTHFYNVQKVVNDMLIVDPSMIMMKDLLDPLPGKLVRAKPQAYGSSMLEKAVHQLKVQDVTQAHMADTGNVFGFMQQMLGVTPQLQGMPQGGSRRTATAERIDATFGVGRQKTVAEFGSATGFTDLASRVLITSQQHYDGEEKLRIAGDHVDFRSAEKYLDVSPESIQGAFDFVPIDGTQPIDRFAMSTLWTQMFQQMAQVPAIMAQYDMGGIFAWIARLAGMTNIQRFKLQVSDAEILAQQLQDGNVVSLSEFGGPSGRGSKPARPGARDETELGRASEPAQNPGVGATS